MDLNEDQVRKQWLIAFYIWVVAGIVGLVVGGYAFLHLPDPDFPLGQHGRMLLYVLLLTPLVLVNWWLAYRYSYTKRGTGWLLLLMVSFAYTVAVTVVYWVKGIPSTINIGTYSRYYEMVQFLVMLYFMFACYRLYQVNITKKHLVDAQTSLAFNSWADTLTSKPRSELNLKEKLVVARQSVLKHWFIAYGLLFIASLCGLIPLLYLVVEHSPADFQLGMYQGMVSWLFIGVFLLWASHYFPYERRGTKWLIFLLVLATFAELGIVLIALTGISTSIVLLALVVLLYLQGAVFSMLMVNKARKQFAKGT